MEEDSVAITYETLYEILRAEKNKEELCELDEKFYSNVLEYIKEKTQILQEASSKNDIFSLDERDNTQVQLQNIRKIIREIYERREKKIIDMALNKSRTNSDIIDTSNLLISEQRFFETVHELFDRFRIGILAQILHLKEPNLEIECSIPADPPEAEPGQEKEAEKAKEKSEQKQEAQEKQSFSELQKPEISVEIPLPEKNMKKIKITQSVEQFVGKELEIYGPYKEEDIAELPFEIAEILIEKGSAIEVQ